MEGKGTKRAFAAPLDKVWPATVRAVQTTGLQIDDMAKPRGTMSAFTPVTWDSWGERVSVWVKAIDQSHTSVEVVSRAAGPELIIHKNWEEPILRNVAINLETDK